MNCGKHGATSVPECWVCDREALTSKLESMTQELDACKWNWARAQEDLDHAQANAKSLALQLEGEGKLAEQLRLTNLQNESLRKSMAEMIEKLTHPLNIALKWCENCGTVTRGPIPESPEKPVARCGESVGGAPPDQCGNVMPCLEHPVVIKRKGVCACGHNEIVHTSYGIGCTWYGCGCAEYKPVEA